MTKAIHNMRHRHAFVLVGEDTLFGVHMTQYHCELHKYQIIIKLRIKNDDSIKQKLAELRKTAPHDTFMLVNKGGIPIEDVFSEYSIPELANGTVKQFAAAIYQGVPPYPKEDEEQEHFIPWKDEYINPVFPDLIVEVERIVWFRPFAHNDRRPPFANYFLFGEGNEAHMTNIQTAARASNAFEPEVFGPDYDHVMSLQEAPEWLDPVMLQSGIVVSAPKVPLENPETGDPTIPCDLVFDEGESIELLYRGMGEVYRAKAGPTYLQLTAVCNGPGGSCLTPRVMPCEKNPGYISLTPRVYWATQS